MVSHCAAPVLLVLMGYSSIIQLGKVCRPHARNELAGNPVSRLVLVGPHAVLLAAPDKRYRRGAILSAASLDVTTACTSKLMRSLQLVIHSSSSLRSWVSIS